jgi:hypothetical protein
MVYNTHNHWGCGLCPSSDILHTGKHNVSETEYVSVLRSDEGETLLGLLERATLSEFFECRTMD